MVKIPPSRVSRSSAEFTNAYYITGLNLPPAIRRDDHAENHRVLCPGMFILRPAGRQPFQFFTGWVEDDLLGRNQRNPPSALQRELPNLELLRLSPLFRYIVLIILTNKNTSTKKIRSISNNVKINSVVFIKQQWS